MAANTANANASTAPANDEATINFHEIGMMFVHEYYTFLNKEPSRLHCFYNKQSTMSHGIQGEEPQICHGQQSIHAKILDLDFEDCKVLVRNVDSQSSLNGGIMIQVLGEMSNKGGPSQKFVQTFFLAVQPKGYYVLNDILRYLKDDPEAETEAEEYEAELLPEAENEDEVFVAVQVPPEAAVEVALDVAEEKVALVAATVAVEAVKPAEATKVENTEEKKPATEEKKSTEKKTDHKRHDRKSEKKEKDSKKDAKKEVERAEKSHAPEPSKRQTESAEATQDQTVSTPTPAAESVAAPAPVPTEPPKPKTWATTVAKNLNPWGHNAPSANAPSVNAPSVKAASVNVPQATPKPQPQSQSQGQSKFQDRRPNGREEYHSIYIKNVTEKMTAEQLREAFATFGPIKNLELVHRRFCAYIDFGTVEAMQAALKQNKVSVGSETVLAEERRRPGPQSGSRPFHYQNTSGGSNGHQGPQGGHRGGRPSRGGFQDRKPIQRPDKAAPTVAVN